MIVSIIRSSRNPRLPQLQTLSARYNLIKKKKKKKKKEVIFKSGPGAGAGKIDACYPPGWQSRPNIM